MNRTRAGETPPQAHEWKAYAAPPKRWLVPLAALCRPGFALPRACPEECGGGGDGGG